MLPSPCPGDEALKALAPSPCVGSTLSPGEPKGEPEDTLGTTTRKNAETLGRALGGSKSSRETDDSVRSVNPALWVELESPPTADLLGVGGL